MNDLEFVQQLMRANSDSLGFIPISSVNKAYGDGRLLIHAVNNERVGYLLFGSIRKGCNNMATVHHSERKGERGWEKSIKSSSRDCVESWG